MGASGFITAPLLLQVRNSKTISLNHKNMTVAPIK
uniref:Uncharacterized protein n=1 Tax=Rhizophora mucronata TaxID=61149 RepID=A0A2P2JAY1_RHIMU